MLPTYLRAALHALQIVSYIHVFFYTRKKGKKKGQHIGGSCPLSDKVFLLLMGCSKNYIMYWGLRLVIYHGLAQTCAQTLPNLKKSFVQFDRMRNRAL